MDTLYFERIFQAQGYSLQEFYQLRQEYTKINLSLAFKSPHFSFILHSSNLLTLATLGQIRFFYPPDS